MYWQISLLDKSFFDVFGCGIFGDAKEDNDGYSQIDADRYLWRDSQSNKDGYERSLTDIENDWSRDTIFDYFDVIDDGASGRVCMAVFPGKQHIGNRIRRYPCDIVSEIRPDDRCKIEIVCKRFRDEESEEIPRYRHYLAKYKSLRRALIQMRLKILVDFFMNKWSRKLIKNILYYLIST